MKTGKYVARVFFMVQACCIKELIIEKMVLNDLKGYAMISTLIILNIKPITMDHLILFMEHIITKWAKESIGVNLKSHIMAV